MIGLKEDKYRIVILLLALFSIFPTFLFSQQRPKTQAYRFGDHWHINLKAGSAMVLTEFDDGFKSFRNEMSHRPDMTASISFSKLISRHWEFGYEYEHSRFNGYSDNPVFSAMEYHENFKRMSVEPVEYKTTSHNHGVNLTYHFLNIGSLSGGRGPVNLFTQIKAGFSIVTCELSYKNDSAGRYPVIFAKRSLKDKDLQNSSLYIGTLQFGAGIGLRYHLNDRFQFTLLNDYTFVNDDLLDAVHNYVVVDANGEEKSNQTNGFYTRIVAGVSYSFNWQFSKFTKSAFYKNKYRSSRYSPIISHRMKKERDIWYRKK